MKITCLGATGTVTGSKYLLEEGGKKIMIDCGLFQGHKELRLRNWERLPVNPRDIDALLLTHAHLDHSGYIPKLVKAGLKGRFTVPRPRSICVKSCCLIVAIFRKMMPNAPTATAIRNINRPCRFTRSRKPAIRLNISSRLILASRTR